MANLRPLRIAGFLALPVLLSFPSTARPISRAMGACCFTKTSGALPGPELGDYMGIPINAAARLRGDSYDADRISVAPEYQCRPHGGDYSMRGLSNMRIGAILDPVTQRWSPGTPACGFQEMERTIWMDGRPHPPDKLRTPGPDSPPAMGGNMLTGTPHI